jgi:murein DD-endopeptidase MepM/ murein hydrolase activator NlpD
LIVVLFSSADISLHAQPREELEGLFDPPLEIPLYLSGNFGELRNNHFHSGLDIKTEGRENLSVFAVAEGHVSRIKISPWGYGNALYLDHPSGHTTVYAHLNGFNEDITNFLENAQYDLESYEVDLYPSPGVLPVYRGEKIAASGNTGSSGGPHLHFEIRETDTEFPLNPLLFGFDIKDNISPIIRSLLVIPLDDSSSVKGSLGSKEFSVGGRGKSCYINQGKTIKGRGKLGLAVNTIDKLDGYPNECGIFGLRMYVDSFLVYEQSLDQLDFSTKRSVNAHVVYEENKRRGKDFHRTYVLPGNKLNIYSCLIQDGVVAIEAGSKHHIQYIIEDVYGNESKLSFYLEWDKREVLTQEEKFEPGVLFKFDEANNYQSEGIKVTLPEGCLYEDIRFNCNTLQGTDETLSPWFKVGDEFEPIHNPVKVSIQLDSLSKEQPGLLLVRKNRRGRLYAEGGKKESDWFTGRSRYFGDFALMVDSTAPYIKNVDLAKNMKGRSSFSFRISDDLSGIETVRPTIDGEWVLMIYDGKRNRITYTFDENRIEHGDHEFLLKVTDERGNVNEYSLDFTW